MKRGREGETNSFEIEPSEWRCLRIQVHYIQTTNSLKHNSVIRIST